MYQSSIRNSTEALRQNRLNDSYKSCTSYDEIIMKSLQRNLPDYTKVEMWSKEELEAIQQSGWPSVLYCRFYKNNVWPSLCTAIIDGGTGICSELDSI